jgi:hypothetical protein
VLFNENIPLQWITFPAVPESADKGDYFYKLTVYTGLKRNAGTKSMVYVNIEGIHGGSGTWKLDPTPHEVTLYKTNFYYFFIINYCRTKRPCH